MGRDYEFGKPGNEAQDKLQAASDSKIGKDVTALLKEATEKKIFIPKSMHNEDAIRNRIDEVEAKRAGKGLD